MGFFDFLFNEKEDVEDKLFEDEADTYDLTEEERKECKQAGITPEEWMEENESEYYNDL